MPKKLPDSEPERSPAEVSALARSLMKRMLETPPKPHETRDNGKPRTRRKKRAK
jgi:hypothetical protein